MDFKEVRALERYFGKYLTYDGFSLWKFIDVALYYKFLGGDDEPTFVEKFRARLIPALVAFRRFQRKKSLNHKNKSKSDVIFFPFAATHLHTFISVVKRLESSKVIVKDGLLSHEVANFANSSNIPFVGIESYFDNGINSDLKQSKMWLRSAWKDILRDPEIKVLFEEKPFIKSSLKYFLFYRKRIIEVIGYIKLIEKIYSIEKPKLVVVSDEHTDFGSVVVTIANKRGIPSLNIQHGMIMFNKVVTSELKATVTAVFGPNDKNYLVKNGLDAKKIVVTGQPRYDSLLNTKLDRTKECAKLGLDPSKKICLFATQYSLNEKDLLLINHVRKMVFDTFKNRKDLQLVVKTHPSDNQDYSSEVSENVKIIKDFSLNKILLNICDALLVISSTVALEGLICGKPLIIVNNGGNIHYIDEGAAPKATNKKELDLILNKVFNDAKVINNLKNKRKAFIYNYAYKLDGKSTERVLELIKGLTK